MFVVRRYTLVILLAGLVAVTAPEAGRASEEGAAAFVQDMAAKVVNSIADKSLSLAERQHRFRKLLHEGLDMEHVAGFVLGPYRRRVDPSDFAEFQEVLEEFIVQSYAWRFRDYAGQTLEVVSVRAAQRGREIVKSHILQPNGGPSLEVSWTLHKKAGDYKVIDIQVQGLSMMTTQRDEYVEFLRGENGRLQSLVEALRKQNKALAQQHSHQSS